MNKEKMEELQELFNELIYRTKDFSNYFRLIGNPFKN